MADVARAARVSRATVSYVLNDLDGQTISPATRERVLDAASRLGYRHNSLARALREGYARVVIARTGGLQYGPMLRRVLDGLGGELAEHGHGLLVSPSPTVDGPTRVAIEVVQPLAVVDLASIAEDSSGAALVAGMVAHFDVQARWLAEQGHHRIAVAWSSGGGEVADHLRMRLRESAAAAGLEVVADLDCVTVEQTRLELESLGDATALAAVSDATALTVLAAAADVGIAVPDQLAVIGFGNTPEGALWRPALTSVELDTFAYGRRIARELLGLAADDGDLPAATIVVRSST